jgi:catechol 2,3-dioxygenase-like lactoylglutathione lyase family enzyme
MPYTGSLVSQVLFDHIAIAVPRMAAAPAVLVGQLGGAPYAGSSSGAYRWGQWRFAGGGRLEILEPIGDDGFLHRFLAQRGAGIHHVTFRVPSVRDACERARAHGYTIVGYYDSDPHWGEAFLHPKQALGIVVQLAEYRSSGEGPRAWRPPPGPPDPPPAVAILGLRMRARSRERARAQWEIVLQGRCAESDDGRLAYRWPGSPMRLVVEIDPTRDEGPVCIEFASDRMISVPDGPDPILGAVFARRSA